MAGAELGQGQGRGSPLQLCAGQEAHSWAGVPWDTGISPIQQQSAMDTNRGWALS